LQKLCERGGFDINGGANSPDLRNITASEIKRQLYVFDFYLPKLRELAKKQELLTAAAQQVRK